VSDLDPEVLREYEEAEEAALLDPELIGEIGGHEPSFVPSEKVEIKNERSPTVQNLVKMGESFLATNFGVPEGTIPSEGAEAVVDFALPAALETGGGAAGATVAGTGTSALLNAVKLGASSTPLGRTATALATVAGGLKGLSETKKLEKDVGLIDDPNLGLLDYFAELGGPIFKLGGKALSRFKLGRTKGEALSELLESGARSNVPEMGAAEATAWSEYLGTSGFKDLRVSEKGVPEMLIVAKKYEPFAVTQTSVGGLAPVPQTVFIENLNKEKDRAAQTIDLVLDRVIQERPTRLIQTPKDVLDLEIDFGIRSKDPSVAADKLLAKFLKRRRLKDGAQLDFLDEIDPNALEKVPDLTRQDLMIRQALRRELEALAPTLFAPGAIPDVQVISYVRNNLRDGLNYAQTSQEAARSSARKILASHLTETLEKRVGDLGDPKALAAYLKAKEVYGETDALTKVLATKGVSNQLSSLTPGATSEAPFLNIRARAQGVGMLPPSIGGGNFLQAREFDAEPRGFVESVMGDLRGIGRKIPLDRGSTQTLDEALRTDFPFFGEKGVDTTTSADGDFAYEAPKIVPPDYLTGMDELGKVVSPEDKAAASGAVTEIYKRDPAKRYRAKMAIHKGEPIPASTINDMGGYAETDFSDPIYALYVENEGGEKLEAYHPGGNNSGVTVSLGIDLGQQNYDELREKLSYPLSAKIRPFMGLKGASAVNALKRRKLVITPEESRELKEAVLTPHRERLSSVIKDAAGVTLEELPKEAQSVLISLEHNLYGIEGKLPKFFNYVVKGKWDSAKNELLKDARRYAKRGDKGLAIRRMKEAEFLTPLIPEAFIAEAPEATGVDTLPDGTTKVRYG